MEKENVDLTKGIITIANTKTDKLLAIIKMGPKIITVVPLKVNNSVELAGSQIGSPLIIN